MNGLLMTRDDIEVCRTPEGKKWRLGEGGFGVVYKALMNGVDEVAVKLVKARVHVCEPAPTASVFVSMRCCCMRAECSSKVRASSKVEAVQGLLLLIELVAMCLDRIHCAWHRSKQFPHLESSDI